MEGAEQQEPARRTRRTRKDGRKQRTRQKLIDATIDIVRADGVGALTTGRIANGAGIQQPGFYAHFKNVDDCLRMAAEQVADHVIQAEARMRRAHVLSSHAQDRQQEIEARMRFAVRLWLDNRRFAEIFTRCRHDATPIGEVCRQTGARAKAELVADLWELAKSLGLRSQWLPDLDLMAALLVAAFVAAIDMTLSSQQRDPDAVAVALARNQYHYVRAELTRMLAEQRDQDATAAPSAT